jgi:hypothetical protein
MQHERVGREKGSIMRAQTTGRSLETLASFIKHLANGHNSFMFSLALLPS